MHEQKDKFYANLLSRLAYHQFSLNTVWLNNTLSFRLLGRDEGIQN